MQGRRFASWGWSLALCLALAPAAQAGQLEPLRKFKPPVPEELALAKPVVDPEAHVEYLTYEEFWDDGTEGAACDVHVKLKVYDATGAQQCATISFDYAAEKTEVTELEGRTILPDGRILPLDRATVSDQVVEQNGRRKSRRRTFALPSVVPGAVLEYRYHVEEVGVLLHFMRLVFQLDHPAQRIEYGIRPYSRGLVARSIEFHSPATRSEVAINGWYEYLALHQPARIEEPDSPPPLQNAGWVLLYYTPTDTPTDQAYWVRLAEYDHNVFDPAIRPDGDAKKLAQEIVGNVQSDTERLEKLAAWMRTSFRVMENMPDDSLKAAGLREVEDGRAALHQRGGTPLAAQLALATLGRASRLDVRLLMASDPSEFHFSPFMTHANFLPNSRIAVRADGRWHVFDASAFWLPADMLRADEEGSMALLCDRDSAQFFNLPVSGPERSVFRTDASLTIEEDGTLAGQVAFTASGHWNAYWRLAFNHVADRELDARLKEKLAADMPGVQFEHVRLERGTSSEVPLRIVTDVRVPNLASFTGSRALLQPEAMLAQCPPRFTAPKRRLPIEFSFARTMQDCIRIRLPEGWTTEGELPSAKVQVRGFGAYTLETRMEPDTRTLVLTRMLRMGDGGVLSFLPGEYAGLRTFFQRVADGDRTTLALVREAAHP